MEKQFPKDNSDSGRRAAPRREEIIGPGKSYKFGKLGVDDTWVVERQIDASHRRRLVILALCVVVILTLLLWH